MNKKYKTSQIVGLFAGLVVALVLWFADITPGLQVEGRRFLGLVLCSVIWWSTKPVGPMFTGTMLLIVTAIANLAPMSSILTLTSGSTFFTYFAIFVFADVIEESELAKRVAFKYAAKFIRNYKSLLISTFVLTFILSILIPQPWPRALLLLSVFSSICGMCNMSKEDAKIVELSVFAASCPISMMFYTGDSGINIIIANMAGIPVGFMDWTKMMFLPGLLASILTLLCIFIFFRRKAEIIIDAEQMKKSIAELGPINPMEKKTIVWLLIAVIGWVTESLHGLDTGSIACLVVVGMSIPYIGGVCTPKNWKSINFGTLVFVTAAMAIGSCGNATGMNKWIASVIFRGAVPESVYALALLIGLVSIVVHMFAGSSISSAAVVVSMVLAYTANAGINPLVPTLMAFTAVYMHYVLPFHHLNIVIGMGKATFTDKDVMRLGIPLTICVFIVLLFEAFLWSALGYVYI